MAYTVSKPKASYRYYLSFLFKVRSRMRICLENYEMGLNT